MNLENKVKDWIFRYNNVLNRKATAKQKELFLKSLVADIYDFRDDIHVTEISTGKKKESGIRNVYIGDVKKADIIISTYYDTPLGFLGSYFFFDVNKSKKQTLTLNIVKSLLLLILGLLITIFIVVPILRNQVGFTWITLLITILFFIYFIILRKSSDGTSRKNNLIRNNATIIFLLELMTKIKSEKIAFALVDRGTQNNLGLEGLKKVAHSKAQIFYLDSIASWNKLYFVGNSKNIKHTNIEELRTNISDDNRLTYIISSEEPVNGPFLSKKELNKKEINNGNIQIIRDFFLGLQ